MFPMCSGAMLVAQKTSNVRSPKLLFGRCNTVLFLSACAFRRPRVFCSREHQAQVRRWLQKHLRQKPGLILSLCAVRSFSINMLANQNALSGKFLPKPEWPPPALSFLMKSMLLPLCVALVMVPSWSGLWLNCSLKLMVLKTSKVCFFWLQPTVLTVLIQPLFGLDALIL